MRIKSLRTSARVTGCWLACAKAASGAARTAASATALISDFMMTYLQTGLSLHRFHTKCEANGFSLVTRSSRENPKFSRYVIARFTSRGSQAFPETAGGMRFRFVVFAVIRIAGVAVFAGR